MTAPAQLNAVEARVLGSLIEKEATTPEYYPLSLNALVNACNQKSSREPVMSLGEGDVREALFALEAMGLVRVEAEGRVSKFSHKAYDRLQLRRPEAAALGVLLLRGAQTPAEIRARSERIFAFDDTEAVAETLQRMVARDDALVRGPLSRGRWVEALSANEGELVMGAGGKQTQGSSSVELRLAELERTVDELRGRLMALEGERVR